MPLYYDEFSDLPVDWPMILVGWRGFAGKKLSAEQVITYALEQIGKGTSEQEDVAALLASADPLDWQTIDRYLEQIVENQQIDRATAIRKWRLSEFKNLLPSLSSSGRVQQHPGDALMSLYEDLFDLWHKYDELPDSVNMMSFGGNTITEVLAEQQAWAEREEAALRGEIGARP